MAEPGTALANRTLSDEQILQRIELNKKSGWGLEKASPSMLNMIFLTCQRHNLLPTEDVTLYDGGVWLTIEGRVKLMRRHPEYRGFTCRPLTKVQREEWNYDQDDIVIECTIRTGKWGDIAARGKVSKAEALGQPIQGVRHNFVARIHPVEMAEKRAITRAERLAFGTDDVLDEDFLNEQARVQIQERTEPARVAANARKYDAIFPDEDGPSGAAEVTAPARSGTGESPTPPAAAPTITLTARSPLASKLAEVIEDAARLEVEFDDCRVEFPAPKEEVIRKTERLEDRVQAKKDKLAGIADGEPLAAQVGF
jgi:hypothetical protein